MFSFKSFLDNKYTLCTRAGMYSSIYRVWSRRRWTAALGRQRWVRSNGEEQEVTTQKSHNKDKISKNTPNQMIEELTDQTTLRSRKKKLAIGVDSLTTNHMVYHRSRHRRGSQSIKPKELKQTPSSEAECPTPEVVRPRRMHKSR